MAKDIKVSKGNQDIIINESNLEYYENKGYKVVTKQEVKQEQVKSKKDKKWQHITEKKEL
tara:strand:+ start:458 stop:637 length:180 start_codon:yes stop_codon:yes gene_type:complete